MAKPEDIWYRVRSSSVAQSILLSSSGPAGFFPICKALTSLDRRDRYINLLPLQKVRSLDWRDGDMGVQPN